MEQAPPRGRERRSPTPGALRKREAIGHLKEALAQGRLELRFQPIVAAADGALTAAEALLKWREGPAGRASLTALIWAAERSPVIFKLENWVLEQAFRAASSWRDARPAGFRLQVNVSAREFPRADLLRRLSRIMRSCRVAPAEIALEITETSAMGALDEVADRLGGLRDLGVTLWLDDFGTGHSSLEWLNHFPLDGVKIAGTFVSRLPGDCRAEIIAAHVIGLAHELGLRVIAEGVENEGQRALLVRLGCDLLQGFLFHPPLQAEELRAALAAAPAPGVLSRA